jgi:hypothetical protein
MPFLSKRLLSALFLLISALLVSAQSENPRTCRILFLQGPDNAPKTLHLFDGTSSL